MKLTHEDIEEYLEFISIGSKLVDINNKTLLFKYPSIYVRMLSRRIYKSDYDKAVEDGLLTYEQMSDLIKQRNIISESERNKLSKIESQLEAQRVLLAKTTRVKANQDRIKDIILNLEKQKYEIEAKERSKFAMTAETRAEEAKILFLCYSSTFDAYTEKLYWDDLDSFKNESNYVFRQAVLSEFISFYTGIRTPIIRAIARSNLWRIKYITSVKTGDSLFSVPISEYTGDMLNLVYWSHYYNNINEMMPEDQPPDDIIEDDEALDAFMQSYHDERSKDVAERKHRKGNKGNLSAFNQEEVIVARTNELFEDIIFDEPREAAAIKNKALVKKKTRRR
jgi:hypothetical protein